MGTFLVTLGFRPSRERAGGQEKYRDNFSVQGLDFIIKVHAKILQIRICACLWAQKTGWWSGSRDIFPGSLQQPR